MIDWSKIPWVRPSDNEIFLFAHGQTNQYNLYCYEYFNWAFKERALNKVCPTSGWPTSEDHYILVELCQEIVRKEGIFYIPEVKKKWWRF